MPIEYEIDPIREDDPDLDIAISDATRAHEEYGWNRGTFWDHNGDAFGEWTWRP